MIASVLGFRSASFFKFCAMGLPKMAAKIPPWIKSSRGHMNRAECFHSPLLRVLTDPAFRVVLVLPVAAKFILSLAQS